MMRTTGWSGTPVEAPSRERTALTGTERYDLKVPQPDFAKLQPMEFSDLEMLAPPVSD